MNSIEKKCIYIVQVEGKWTCIISVLGPGVNIKQSMPILYIETPFSHLICLFIEVDLFIHWVTEKTRSIILYSCMNDARVSLKL
jgi:hypothetical protein